jgi:NTP pyrophosphatase (non-canonical NTP hydrolase)
MSYPMTLDDMARSIHEQNRAKGFYDRERLVVKDPVTGDVEGRPVNPSLPSEKLLLICSEVCEAQDALRNNDQANEAEEIADILIRTLDYAAWRGINLDREVWAKVGKNRDRPDLHGRKGF